MDLNIKISKKDYEILKEKFESKKVEEALEQLDNLVFDESEEMYHGIICITDKQILYLVYIFKRLYHRRFYNFSVVFVDSETHLKNTERFQDYKEMLKRLEHRESNKEIDEIYDDTQDIDITMEVLKDLESLKTTGKFNPLSIDIDEDDDSI